MINFDFKTNCYSCSACLDICPKNAIGFDSLLHPIVDKTKCINCGLCEKKCIELSKPLPRVFDKNGNGYVVKNKTDSIRKDSSSGGVFISLAEEVVKNGGYVCGCIYDESFMPRHVVTNDFDICKKMMGSKYVKSDMSGCIAEIKKLTNEEKTVLFTGVPCQVAAVKSCVDNENLITLAVVCHGSIERDIWEKFLKEEAQNKKIVSITMRDKSRGFLNYGLRVSFDDGTESLTYKNNDG